MFKRLSIIIALMGILSIFAFAGTAQAEQCSADGKICLVTDVSQPFVPPKTLEFKVASEASYFGLDGGVACSRQLLQQGPAGGMSSWSIGLCAVHSDGDRAVLAGAGGPGFESSLAFSMPVLAASANMHMTLRSTKTQVQATYTFEARTSLLVSLQLYLNAFPKGKTLILALRSKKVVVEPGTHSITVSMPRKVITDKCQPYGGCFALGYGRSWVSAPGLPERAEEADVQTDFRQKVYTRPSARHRKPKKHHQG